VDRRGAALGRLALLTLPLAFVALFFAYPLAKIVGLGLRPDGELSLEGIRAVVVDPALRAVIAFTMEQAVLATVVTIVVGLPAAFAIARFRFPGRQVVRALALVPFVLPTVVVGLAFGGGEGSWLALIAATTFFNVAVVIRVVGDAWGTIDPSIEDAAEELGARGWRRVTAVMIPLARPAIAAAAVLVALFAFLSFGVALLLAPPGHGTIEVEIWRQTTSFLDLPVASALTLIQIAFTAALLGVESLVGGGAGADRAGTADQPVRSPRTTGERAFLVATLGGLLLFLALPLLRVVARSVRSGDGFTLDRYVHLGQGRQGSLFAIDPASAVATSLKTSLAATAIALAVGLPAAFALARGGRARISWIASGLPLGVSAVAVGLGYVVAFRQPPLDLRSSWWILPIAQAVVALPFVLRVVSPRVAAIRRELTEQAAALGASPWRTLLDVTLPVAAPAIATATAFAFAISLGEFGAASFLARADAPTMPIAIVRLLGQPGASSLGQAYAMATILMVVTAGATLAVGGAGRLLADPRPG
jgi:thiamine transport system permease protein